MKSQCLKWIFVCLSVLQLTACGGNDNKDRTTETATANPTGSNVTAPAPKLSAENQQLAENCNQSDQESCKKLVESLVKECESNNAQSCVDSAVIFIKLNEDAVRANNNQLAVQSYNYAVGALVKACDLGYQGACDSLKELSNNIFGNLKNLKNQCESQKNTEACSVIQQAKKVLENSCQSGKQQDCEYLRSL